jgi:2-polyprenyl-3-methyl-5-hydroxy-6-metoxy-1,4-benzoquinol methylase
MKNKEQTKYWVDPQTGEPRYDFEDMYKDISDPWGCSQGVDSLPNRIFLEMLFYPDTVYENILDIGCGLGDLSNMIYKKNIQNSGHGGRVTATDISVAAIKKAQIKYPEIQFKKFDLMNESVNGMRKFNLITMSEVLWYMVSDLDKVFFKLSQLLTKEGKIAIKQYFPNKQSYFKEYLSEPIKLEKLLQTHNIRLLSYISITSDEGEVACLLFK